MKLNGLIKQKLRKTFTILLLILLPIVILVVINIKPYFYYTEEDVEHLKEGMVDSALAYQNDEGLFIETSIDSNFYAITSIPFTNGVEVEAVHGDIEALIKFIWSKQTPFEGGYSDIALLGNIEDTYMVFKSIQQLNASFLNTSIYYRNFNVFGKNYAISNENKTNYLLNFLNNSYINNSGGFAPKAYLTQPDIQSTCLALELYQYYDPNWLVENNASVLNYVDSLITGNASFGFGYRLSNITLNPDPISTYFGLKIRSILNSNPNASETLLFQIYLNSTQQVDGGYASYPGGSSNLFTTNFALAALDLLGLDSEDKVTCQNYVLNCFRLIDGGFGITPSATKSDFLSGWSALLALNFTDYVFPNDTIKLSYRDWLREHRAQNSLFGEKTMDAIYYGVSSVENSDFGFDNYLNPVSNGSRFINISNIESFLISCLNVDGGFGYSPSEESTLKATFQALKIAKTLQLDTITDDDIQLQNTMDYIITLQNPDGGFKIGADLDGMITAFAGDALDDYSAILNENLSSVETSYWAYASLLDIRSLNWNLLDFNQHEDFQRNLLVKWTRSLQNADGGFTSVTGFKSEMVGTYHALMLMDLLNEEPNSLISAVEFLKGAQTDDGGFFLSPFFSEYLDAKATFVLTYFAEKSLNMNSYKAENWLKLMLYLALCLDPLNYGFGDIPLFGTDLRNIPYSVEIIERVPRIEFFVPDQWNVLIIGILIMEIGILFIYSFVKLFEKIGLFQVRRRRARRIEKFTYAEGTSAVFTNNLTVFAGGKRIIENVSMELPHGEILGVLGESGAGKSTFIKALLGMRRFSGTNLMYGLNMKRAKKKLKPLYGYVPQDLSKIYSNFTVMENFLYFGKQYGLFGKEILQRGEKLLRNLGIYEKKDELVKNLSGGQKRRVSIAIALIHNPIFCILDEPTSGLDPVVRESLWLRLVELNEQFGTTFIVITHYPEESKFCDKVAIFGRKRGMIDFGNPNELLKLLPGNGRALDLYFTDKIDNAAERISKINFIDNILEKKDGEIFTLFTDESIDIVRRILNEEFGVSKIKAITQEDVEMEDYFRYRALEVVIDK